MAHANAPFRAAMGVMRPAKPAAKKLARTDAIPVAHANAQPNVRMVAISAAIHVAIINAKMAANSTAHALARATASMAAKRTAHANHPKAAKMASTKMVHANAQMPAKTAVMKKDSFVHVHSHAKPAVTRPEPNALVRQTVSQDLLVMKILENVNV